MSNTQTQNTWSLIQEGMKETERLLGQKSYNLCMLKARQTLEYMVKSLYQNVGDANAELIDMIDDLYRNKLISKTSCENYHKIRMIGNKAAHQNDNNAYSANKAYSLLSQEVVAFSNDKYVKQVNRRNLGSSRTKSSSGRGLVRKRRQRGFNISDIIKLSIPLLLIILLIVLLRYCSKTNTSETLPAQTTTAESSTVAESTTAAVVESTTAAEEVITSVTYVTTSNLNVRSAPSTEGTKLATLPQGTEVAFVRQYDDQWSIINFGDAQAYVASQYITPKQ